LIFGDGYQCPHLFTSADVEPSSKAVREGCHAVTETVQVAALIELSFAALVPEQAAIETHDMRGNRAISDGIG
jgi:hypothetical protein